MLNRLQSKAEQSLGDWRGSEEFVRGLGDVREVRERFGRGSSGSGDVRKGSKRFRRCLLEVEKGMEQLQGRTKDN